MMKTKHSYERIETGWNVRDGEGELIAVVPDSAHEREGDARRVARGLDLDEKARKSRRRRGATR